jgi:hypothetical protein
MYGKQRRFKSFVFVSVTNEGFTGEKFVIVAEKDLES